MEESTEAAKVVSEEPNLVPSTKEKEELDGEFIKVERHVSPVEEEEPKPPSSTARDVLEAQEKAAELEHELARAAASLKDSESQNADLKHQLSTTTDSLHKTESKFEDLLLNHQHLQSQYEQAQDKYTAQRKALDEALQSQQLKDKELAGVNESFTSLTLEFDASKSKLQDLEQQLQATADEARKYEELHKESGSHAESQTSRALEFETSLELARASEKQMGDQLTSLKQELTALNEKIAENEKVEAALAATTAKLSAAEGELELTRSQVEDVEKRLASKEAILQELSQQHDAIKASESQLKEDHSALQNLHSSTTEEHQSKLSDLEAAKLKLEEEMSARELNQQEKASLLLEEVAKAQQEKKALEAAVADLTSNAAMMKELCSDLESRLQHSDENFSKTDSLLNQALENTRELELKLKTLEDLHQESGNAAETAKLKHLELEESLQASNTAADDAKSQLREFETRCIAAEQRTVELEQLLNVVELKGNDAERELRDSSQKVSELQAAVDKAGEEKELLKAQIQEFQDKVAELEGHSTTRHAELELELKNVMGRCDEHEGHATKMTQRSLELEDLLKDSHAKAEEGGQKASQLELLLETEKYRIQELEDQVATLDKKYQDAEAESKNHLQKVSELESELEAYKSKASSLEIVLQESSEKEKELTECLAILTKEKKGLEDASRSLTEKLAESEELVQVLQNETAAARESLESLEKDVRAAGLKESEFMEKLKSAEEQLDHHGKLLEHATARSVELESLHETLTRDSETKLQEVFASKDLESKSFNDKLIVLEDQVKRYEEQLADSAEKCASLKEELDQASLKLTSAQNANEDLLSKVSEAESKCAQYISDNEMLADTNAELKARVNEVEEVVKASTAEKEAAALQLASHMNTITELTEQHSRASELHSASETRISEAEKQLQEAIERFAHSDSEAKELMGKLSVLETQLKANEELAQESAAVAEAQKVQLEQTIGKLSSLESVIEELERKLGESQQENEKLLETNIKLAEELASHESKSSVALKDLAAVVAEKDGTAEQLDAAKKAIEELTKQLDSQQSQISSVVEEKTLHEVSKKELEATVIRLEEQLKEQVSNEGTLKTEIEALKAEVSQKSTLETHMAELKEKLEACDQKESVIRKQLEESEAKKKEVEQKLELAEAKAKEEDVVAGTRGISVESREMGITTPPSKRKSKKRSEASSSTAQTTEIHSDASPLSTLKFILGVALVSVVIGVFLGKKY